MPSVQGSSTPAGIKATRQSLPNRSRMGRSTFPSSSCSPTPISGDRGCPGSLRLCHEHRTPSEALPRRAFRVEIAEPARALATPVAVVHGRA